MNSKIVLLATKYVPEPNHSSFTVVGTMYYT